MNNYQLVSAKQMLMNAKVHKYAVAQFNINNLEWTKTIIATAQANHIPVILGVSEGAMKYMGGVKTVVNMVHGLMEFYEVTVPIALHLDHGSSYESVIKAIDSGFTSVMFDGSKYDFEDNYLITQRIIDYIGMKDISLEVELGTIGGEEDGVVGSGTIADLTECEKMSQLKGVDIIAAGINNIHGPYPANWNGLRFDVLKELSKLNIGLVLHGGSGIPFDQVLAAIELGITKINVNTECQLVFCNALASYFLNGTHEKASKGYDPRRILKPGCEAIADLIVDLTKKFGSYNKAL